MAHPAKHKNQAYELTGPTAYDYYQVADMLSDALGRKIIYRNPGILAFLWRQWRVGTPMGFALVMAAIYTTARIGKAAGYSPTLLTLLGYNPETLEEFIARNKALWE